MDLDKNALEQACIAHIKWVAAAHNIEVYRIVNSEPIETHRSYLRKHPEVEAEIREIIAAYLSAVKGAGQ